MPIDHRWKISLIYGDEGPFLENIFPPNDLSDKIVLRHVRKKGPFDILHEYSFVILH